MKDHISGIELFWLTAVIMGLIGVLLYYGLADRQWQSRVSGRLIIEPETQPQRLERKVNKILWKLGEQK